MEKSRIVGEPEEIASGKFLALQTLHFLAQDGCVHAWESVSRVRSSGAVVLIATLVPSGRILLIRQFRPPAASYVWEFPAGLLDPGETPAETAVRELREETGYVGKVVSCSCPVFSSPGLSSETLCFVRMTVEEAGQEHPVPEFDGTECIETFAVAPGEPMRRLVEEGVRQGDTVDAKVETFLLASTLFAQSAE